MYCQIKHLCLGIDHNSAEYLHVLIEALQLSFADSQWYCADPSKVEVPVEGMLSKEYAAKRRGLIDPSKSVQCSLTLYNVMHCVFHIN